MNRIHKNFIHIFIIAAVIQFATPAAFAEIVIQNVQPTDVTSSGFAVIWQTSEAALPQIAIFSDAAGTNEITTEFEVTPIPLYGGNPDVIDEYYREAEIAILRDLSKSLGSMKIGVQGCSPKTTYYYRLYSEGLSGEIVYWPQGNLASITTAGESAFVSGPKQLLVTVVDDSETLNAAGWLVTAFSSETLYSVSTFVGDGAGMNQAYLDLSNLFDGDQNNWTPAGLKVITLEVRVPGSQIVRRNLALFFPNDFQVSAVKRIEINVDGSQDVSTPVVEASPPGGTYNSVQSVILTSNEESYIYFTLDESIPTTASTLYSDPIQVDETTILKFMAVDWAGNQSALVSELYLIDFNLPPFEPSFPDPDDLNAGVSIETRLSWLGGDPDQDDVVSYDLFLGLSEIGLSDVCVEQTEPSCLPGALQFETTYFWQVVAKDSRGGETTGPVWRFTTFSRQGDEDMDGLNNADEIFWGSNPFDWDTDKDGHRDGDEIAWGSLPTDGESIPNIDCEGDFNFDGDVDASDIAVFIDAFGSALGDARFITAADFDGDNEVDDRDYIIFTKDFGRVNCPDVASPADLDGDGDIDEQDMNQFISALGTCGGSAGYMGQADYDGDGCITNSDYAIWYGYYYLGKE